VPTVANDQFRPLFDQLLMQLHRDAMSARDVEDLLRFLRIFHYTMLDQMTEEQAAATAGKRAYTPDDALAWEARFKELLTAFEAADGAIARAEGAGFTIDGVAAFREAHLDLRGMLSVPIERLQQAAESVRQGRGRSLAEVRDGIRRRLHA
jgi:hypothetical protein